MMDEAGTKPLLFFRISAVHKEFAGKRKKSGLEYSSYNCEKIINR